jgi:hypothetical protein
MSRFIVYQSQTDVTVVYQIFHVTSEGLMTELTTMRNVIVNG